MEQKICKDRDSYCSRKFPTSRVCTTRHKCQQGIYLMFHNQNMNKEAISDCNHTHNLYMKWYVNISYLLKSTHSAIKLL